jgi:hypothetical protein
LLPAQRDRQWTDWAALGKGMRQDRTAVSLAKPDSAGHPNTVPNAHTHTEQLGAGADTQRECYAG